MNLKKTDNKEIIEERVCKKCGNPLRSANKHNYCDNCRWERAKTRREAMELCFGVGVIVLSVVSSVKYFVNTKY